MGRKSWDRDVSEAVLQEYVAESFQNLGLARIAGPFAMGPDFEGEVGGVRTKIEVEKEWRHYLIHGHHRNPLYDDVGILVLFSRTEPRAGDRSLLPRRIISIDQGDFRKWLADREQRRVRKEAILKEHFEGVEIHIEKDGERIFSTSISLDAGVDLRNVDYEELAAYYSMVRNQKSFRVMQELLKRRELRFSDMSDITGNPKLARDRINAMMERGIITHEHGRSYRLSARGGVIASYLTLAIPVAHKFIDGTEREALTEMEAEQIE